jgi:2-dehydropantoate 2-reductase
VKTAEGGQTRIAVVGPGAVGAATAALVRRTAEPILCGRSPLERIVVAREGGGEEVVPGPVITTPAAVPWRADLVLLAVKAHQTEAAAPFLRALSGPGTVVVVLQNGVEQRALVEPHAPGATVLPAVVWFPVERLAPDRVLVRDEPRITLPDEPAARAVADLLDAVELTDDFATPAWRKLAVNAVAGLMVLSGRRAGMFRRPDVHALARVLAAECLAVARAEGADLPDAVADELADEFAAYPEDLGSSILFDREAGLELEWDARNGVVARLGARHGIPTPVSDVIVPLLAAASAP